jgi:hypothetical protein
MPIPLSNKGHDNSNHEKRGQQDSQNDNSMRNAANPKHQQHGVSSQYFFFFGIPGDKTNSFLTKYLRRLYRRVGTIF